MEQGISDFEYAIIVIVDEFQEFTQDGICAELLRRIVTAGRAAQIHCVLATQHPTWKAFGGEMAIKRNLPGRLALRVLDQKASEVVLGRPQPRADLLGGAGDAYVVGSATIHRVQIALVDKADWESLPRYETPIRAWGPLTDIGQEPIPRGGFTGRELACGIVAAKLGLGRIKLLKLLQRQGLGAGSVRADRLANLGREILEALADLGFVVKQAEAAIKLGGEE
jgi:DNA segregation ATPase FtsK/SpoIIIE-like protein